MDQKIDMNLCRISKSNRHIYQGGLGQSHALCAEITRLTKTYEGEGFKWGEMKEDRVKALQNPVVFLRKGD